MKKIKIVVEYKTLIKLNYMCVYSNVLATVQPFLTVIAQT